MKVFLIAVMVAVGMSAIAVPGVYIRQQTVVSLRYQGKPKLLTRSGADVKRDAFFETRETYYGDPLLKTEKFYRASTPEGDLFDPYLMTTREGGVKHEFLNPTIPIVTYGWRQFRLGQMRVDSGDDLLQCTYTGWLAVDNRAEQTAYTMVMWFQSDKGPFKRFTFTVLPGVMLDFTPKLEEDNIAVWTMVSCTPYPK